MSAGTFSVGTRPYDDPVVVGLVAAVQAEYVERYGAPDEAVVDPAEFAAPNGTFLVGTLDGVAVAMGGWRTLAGGDAELKRMYVVTAARRRGLALRMLAELERSAARSGIRRLVLNTGPEQPEAIALYERQGYTAIPGFGHYVRYPDALFYGKAL